MMNRPCVLLQLSVLVLFCVLCVSATHGQGGEPAPLPDRKSLFNGKDLTGWVDVNTSPETWSVRDGMLICKGKPIGVISKEQAAPVVKTKGEN